MAIETNPALDELSVLLGVDRVISSEEELRDWRDPFSFETWDD